ncbi:DsbE family thiol:disulfide interchange protein [Vibrio kasasachensis]|uniref:DsbE family thiol:disulfide interchange protein n=1 Tax=Vibrio kasasachensis TaxID=2910248 RepID=UPI003D09B000
MLLHKHKITLFIVGLGAFITLLLLGVYSQPSGAEVKSTVRQFPIQQVTTLLQQQALKPESLLREEYQLVNVWASWCGICRSEHSFLNQLAKHGVPIVGLNYRDKRSHALSYLDDLGNPYQEIIYDPSGKFSIDLGVMGTPETYLIDRKGGVVAKFSGELDEKSWDRFFARYFGLKD